MNVKCDNEKMNGEKFMGWNHFKIIKHYEKDIHIYDDAVIVCGGFSANGQHDVLRTFG
jgi:hypothetical protein